MATGGSDKSVSVSELDRVVEGPPWRAELPPAARPGHPDRNDMEVLSRDECLALLRNAALGRVAMIVGGVPVVVPVNFAVLGEDVVFRTGTGSKLVAAVERSPLSFEVDAFDVTARSGWSVLVTGGASEITRPDELAAAAALGLQSWVAGRERYIRIRSEAVSGRRSR
jgi:nitroimidazol reductase NimA-like FMN-containing flavoprotein (pyridoxamine 5'-phosphate oxidase superfamily)